MRRGGGRRRWLLYHSGAGSQKHGHRWKRRNENDKFFHSVEGLSKDDSVQVPSADVLEAKFFRF